MAIETEHEWVCPAAECDNKATAPIHTLMHCRKVCPAHAKLYHRGRKGKLRLGPPSQAEIEWGQQLTIEDLHAIRKLTYV